MQFFSIADTARGGAHLQGDVAELARDFVYVLEEWKARWLPLAPPRYVALVSALLLLFVHEQGHTGQDPRERSCTLCHLQRH